MNNLADEPQNTYDTHIKRLKKCDNKNILNSSLRPEETLHPLFKFYTVCKDIVKIFIILIFISFSKICRENSSFSSVDVLFIGKISFHCHNIPFVQKVKESHFVV